jgi:hypothetical protein
MEFWCPVPEKAGIRIRSSRGLFVSKIWILVRRSIERKEPDLSAYQRRNLDPSINEISQIFTKPFYL